MLEHAQDLIRRAATQLGWSTDKVDTFLELDHEHKATLSIDGVSYDAFRMQHNNRRGPYKGGVRFHPEVTDDEVRALATLMSVKSAVLDIPMGGGKGGVIVDAKSKSTEELEGIARAYVRAFIDHLGPDIDVPAPDVNTDAQIIDWMVDEYETLTGDTSKASFTGKSMRGGGSEGRTAATGRGGVIALREHCRLNSIDPQTLTVAVQGVGNVGFYFAGLVRSELGARVVAMSNSRQTFVQSKGFDMGGLAFSRTVATELETQADSVTDRDAVLSQDVDVLVLAALGDVVDEGNQASVKASIILELANGPLSTGALDAMESRGVVVIPDVVANAGGVVVSYLEWKQNKAGEHWSETRVNEQLDLLMSDAMKAMNSTAEEYSTDLSEAAYIVALKRLG